MYSGLFPSRRNQSPSQSPETLSTELTMYGHHVSSRRRKKRPMGHGIKNVQVSRGKSGYGFTISGQHPCVLSCIVGGSPADLAGLKAGDYLYIVNGVNVSHAPHDDVVRMVGQSTGTLELQVAENYNSSDSSEDDYPPRTKSRYPNRVRFRQAHVGGSNIGGGVASKGLGGIASRPLPQRPGDAAGSELRTHHVSHQHNRMHRNHIPVGADSDLSTSVTSPSSSLSEEKTRDDRSRHDYEEYHRQRQRPVYERIGRYPSSSKITDSSTTDMSGDGLAFTMATVQTRPVINTAKISSAASKRHPSKLQDTYSKSASLGVAESVSRPSSSPSAAGSTPLGEVEGIAVGEDQDVGEGEIMPQGGNEARAVVGYIGSIELPANLNRPNQQLQQLRNAVRRLRVEQKIHTLVLMQVDSTGVRLTNDLGGTVAHYTVDKLAFSGICPDDKRFFGIVTLHSVADDISEFSGCADGGSPSSSCHVFMVDPDMCSHLLHNHKSKAFGFTCTPSPILPQRCLEFPHSPTSLILCIAALYRDRPRSKLDHDIIQSHAFADPSQPTNHSSSNSSNSDSGFGRDVAPGKNKEQVCIVEMGADNAAGTSSGNGDNSSANSSAGASSRDMSSASSLGAPISRSMGSLPHHLSPFVTHPLTTPFSTPQGRQRPMSAFEIRRGLNNSSSSEECWAAKGHARVDKLTPRAMPDPATTHLLPRAISHEGLNSNTSAENLRQSMQRLLQARQQQLQNEQALSCSDSESQVSHAQPYPRSSNDHLPVQSAFQVPRPVSAPLRSRGRLRVADLGFGKLSPRAIQPLGKPTRSPSAPPAPYFPHQDSDDDDDDTESEDDPFVRTIITQFTRDRVLDLGDDGTNPRRFSEGYALGRQREMEQAEREELHKWTKTGSFRRHHNASKLKVNVSQSHESLAVADADGGGGLAKMVAANSVNSMAMGVRGGMMEEDEEDSLGRVARWAVGLPRLLSDPLGLSIFTEFLKKEFSQENVTFWTAVEAYRQLPNDDMRRSKAHEIYSTHLSSQASEPVNVDSIARHRAEQHLSSPVPEMFDIAQTQIFHLMRTDSYTRFLKSDLYKGHLMREMEGHTLLVPNVASSKATQQDVKKKGKGKENEDKRRKSLLPWRQNKKVVKEGKSKGKEEKKEREMNNNLKKAPGPGIDLSTMRKEVFQPRETEKPDGEPVKFCRVVMPDTSTTVVCTRPGHTIRSVLGKLCDKRGIAIAYVDVFLLGSDKPLNLEEDISTLGSKEVVIERRVLFRLDLPNHKSIGVKAKPNRCIRDVFKPILNKYGYHMDQCGVQLAGLSELLDLDIPVSDLDNQRVHVFVNSDRVTALPETGARPPQPHRQPRTPLHLLPVSSATASSYPSTKGRGSAKSGSLEEITNQIFEDLMKGKSELAHTFDELGVVDLERGRKQASKNNDEHRSLGLFGRLKNESWRTKENNKKGKSKGRVTFTLPRSDSKKKKKATKEEEPAKAEDPHPASSSSGVRNDLASFMASSCVETVDLATFTAENNPLLLPPPDMFDDVHYMHSRLADVANGATYDDDGEEDVDDFSAEPYFQTSTPRFLTFGTPRSKTAPSAFTSAKQQLLVKEEEEKPCVSLQPVIIEADSGGSVLKREAYREKGDLQTLGKTISPHFDDAVHTFRPTRLGPAAASALGCFKVPLASPDLALDNDRVSPGRECPDLGAAQRLRPIPARRNLVKDTVGVTPPKMGTSQLEVSVEVHQCTEAQHCTDTQKGVKQPSPQGHSQDRSASRTSLHSLDRTSPSSHLSTPSPASLQSSSPHHPPAAPEYTPPPPYSAAVSHGAVGMRAKMSPSPAKSRGTPRPMPPNTSMIHVETPRLSPPNDSGTQRHLSPTNDGTQRLLPPNSGEMQRLSPPNNDGMQKHSPPNNSAIHRGMQKQSPPNRQSAIPVPAPRGASGMSSDVLVPRGRVDRVAGEPQAVMEAPLVEELTAQQSRASPRSGSPHAPGQAKRSHVKSPLNHDRPPVPRGQSSSSMNPPAFGKQEEGCSPADSPGTQAGHLTYGVLNSGRSVAGPLSPNRSGSLDSVTAARGGEEGRVSLQDGDFLGGKETAKHLMRSNMNSSLAPHSGSVTSRIGTINGSAPEVAWGTGHQKKLGPTNGYVIHPYRGPDPTRGSQLDSTSFTGTFSPHNISHPSDLNNPQPHQGLAGSGNGDRGGISQNGARLFMQAFDTSGLLEQTVTFV